MNDELRKQAFLKRFLEGDDVQTSANLTQPSSTHNFADPSSLGLGQQQASNDFGSRSISRGMQETPHLASLGIADSISASVEKLKKENEELKEKYERLTKLTQESLVKMSELENKVQRQKIATLMAETGIVKNFSEDVWFEPPEIKAMTNEAEELKAQINACKNPTQKSLLKNNLESKRKKIKQLKDSRQQIYDLMSPLTSKYYPSMILNDGKIQLLEHIGSGGFASVWKAWDYEQAKIVAIKITKFLSSQNMQFINRHLKREQNIMEATNHKNVVNIYRRFDIDDDKAFAMEFCEGGDLESLMKKTGKFPEVEAHSIISQIIDGLLSLKSKPDDSGNEVIIHYDLKPANILFDNNLTPKIADFGLSKVSDDGKSLLLSTAGGGTLGYSAPETFDNQNKITLSADTWSIGIIFYEMLTGDMSLKQTLRSGIDIVTEFKEGSRKQSSSLSEGAKNFIITCLERDPHKRPTIKKLADDPYIKATPTPQPKRKSKAKEKPTPK